MPQYSQAFTLTGGPQPTFFDDFTSLSLYDHNNPQNGGTWMPGRWYNPNWDGEIQPGNAGWTLNPFNPSTPDNTVYELDRPFDQTFSSEFGPDAGNPTALRMNIKVTPSNLLSAVQSAPYLQGMLTTNPSFRQRFGYFEARVRLETIQGASFAWWMLNEVDPPEIDTIELVSPSGHSNDAWMAHFGIIDFSTIQSTNDWFNWQAGSPFQTFDVTQWHTYAVDWQQTTTTVYVDRTAVSSFATPNGYNTTSCPPCFVVLDWGAGVTGGWSGPITDPTPLPKGALVDYVGIWTVRPF